MVGTKPSDGEAAMACEALAAEAQGRRQYRSAAILRRAAHVLRAFGPMLEALEAVDGEVPAMEGHLHHAMKVEVSSESLLKVETALALARETADGGQPSVKLDPQHFACRRDRCGYRFPESELLDGNWCPKCGGRVEPLPRAVHTFAPGYSSSPRR